MHSNQLQEILQRSSQERYDYFLKTAIVIEEVWLIVDEGQFVLLGGAGQVRAVPVWPSRESAELLLLEEWAHCRAESMNLYHFLSWLEKVNPRDLKIAVFPGRDLKTALVHPAQMKAHFIRELTNG